MVRLQPPDLAALDAVIADKFPEASRPTGIRAILTQWFRAKGYLKK
jgi:hypothetical protein